ncbi:MAG: PAS-domain containing protein [Sphingopyxis sp.]|jgi:hypothetical protein|nr:PAS-domain containing protein [Sphingopyxis sp.]
MASIEPTLTIVGAVTALWLIVASWAIVRGVMMQRNAAYAQRRALQLAALLEGAPAAPLVIKGDGKLEGPGSIAVMLGLATLPSHLDQLPEATAESLTASDVTAFQQNVLLCQRSAKSFSQNLRSPRGERTLAVRGIPAPEEIAPTGSALIWLTDVSESEQQVRQLKRQREDAVAAFDAITALIDAAPMPMWFRDARMDLALVNQAYVRAVDGENARDVIDRQIELIEPVAGVSARDAAQSAHDAGEARDRHIPATIGGARRMTLVVDVPIAEVGVAGYAIDRHELDEAQGRYRRFAEARRAMLDEMSAAVAEFSADRTLTFVNRPFLRLFGLDEEWAASAPAFERVLDRLRDNGRTPEVRDFSGWRAERRQWFAATELVEESWMLRDGTHLRAVAQPSPNGGLLLILEDQTEQIRLASARDTLLRVRTATFDNLFEAVAVFSPDGRLNLWNQRFRKLWDVSEEYLVGHPRLDAMLEKVSPRLADPRQHNVLRQMVAAATSERQQRLGRISFADETHFDFAAIPLPDGNALLTLIDVTDSRRIERALRDRAEALEAADRVKTDFLSRISYELRTPLTSIGGFAEMLAAGYAGELSDTGKNYVKAILDSSELLEQQIATVLDLAQSEAGTLPIERRTISLNAILRSAADAVATEARAKNIVVRFDVRAGLGQISGDARRLRQAVDLMLAGAMAAYDDAQHQPDGGKRIILYGDGDQNVAQIIVSDNGPGREVAGTHAVGLALVRQLAAAHNGSAEHLFREGEGSMTSITLPR